MYLDDIVACNTTFEEHMQHLEQVFQVLCDNELYIVLMQEGHPITYESRKLNDTERR